MHYNDLNGRNLHPRKLGELTTPRGAVRIALATK
jgi:hypothetical protein